MYVIRLLASMVAIHDIYALPAGPRYAHTTWICAARLAVFELSAAEEPPPCCPNKLGTGLSKLPPTILH